MAPYKCPQIVFGFHLMLSYKAVVLKLFHVGDPQIDTFQSADPQLKRYARDTHIKEDFTALAVILNHFISRTTSVTCILGHGPPFDGISITGTPIYI